jgi:hypothetical protein
MLNEEEIKNLNVKQQKSNTNQQKAGMWRTERPQKKP